jgi:drug/metabolite transporter (DMT)-like permease
MLCGTLVCAAAQVLMKQGAGLLAANSGMVQTVLAMITNVRLLAGYTLYGVFTAMMTVALRHGELSRLQPIISLTYVWVAFLSVVIFGESVNPYKLAGIVVIIAGVAMLGQGDRS